MSVLDEFARRFDEAQQASPFYFGGAGSYEAAREVLAGTRRPPSREPVEGAAPRGFNPRVIVARIVLNTESPDVAEAVVEQLAALVRLWPEVAYTGWAVTTKAAME